MPEKNFNLNHETPLQGEFQLGELNLVLAFQVNCPGCFLYALPMFNELYLQYQDRISMLGLSTAFEDFDLNTETNTVKLLETGSVVGETKKALSRYQLERYPNPILFPVAMDHAMTETERNEYLQSDSAVPGTQSLPLLSATFWHNRMHGTPDFYLFDSDQQTLGHWFGHVKPEAISTAIEKHINN